MNQSVYANSCDRLESRGGRVNYENKELEFAIAKFKCDNAKLRIKNKDLEMKNGNLARINARLAKEREEACGIIKRRKRMEKSVVEIQQESQWISGENQRLRDGNSQLQQKLKCLQTGVRNMHSSYC